MLLDVLRYLMPDVKCTIVGEPATADEYANGVIWHDERPQPSWEQIQAAQPLWEAQQAAERIKTLRQDAYIAESDPLFFKWQRGEGTEQAWRDKVDEIRQRYPDPT